MSEATKRTVCTLLGCDYDKCQWRDDGYGGGGYYGSAYSGGGEVAKDEKNAPVTFIHFGFPLCGPMKNDSLSL